MISSKTRWMRFVLSLILVAVFCMLAYLLFKKQAEKYGYDSFHVEHEVGSVFIPNIDRLRSKIVSPDQFILDSIPQDLQAGISAAITNQTFSFANNLSADCFISWSVTDFAIAFKTGSLSSADLSGLLTTHFSTSSTFQENELVIGNKAYLVNQFNHFLVISTSEITPQIVEERRNWGNADYILSSATHPNGVRHILDDRFHHFIWEDTLIGAKGNAFLHQPFLTLAPSSFSQINYYGSERFEEDSKVFFPNSSAEEFGWVDGGLIYVQKDSFDLLIAPQNSEMDLALLLEEQTLAARGDTNYLPVFTIGSREVMPFSTTLDWRKSLEGLDENFAFFTSINNYTILANSIPAMRWYLGEVQLGNLFPKNTSLLSIYKQAVPQRVHSFELKHGIGFDYTVESKLFSDNNTCIHTSCKAGGTVLSADAVKMIADFEIDFIPSSLQVLMQQDSICILASGKEKLALYTSSGTLKWSAAITSPVNGIPQIIDLENDGTHEIVLFQTNQLHILKSDGQAVIGFPKKLSAPSQGGIAVNYDNAFNYRFLISIGNQVKSLDESGNAVVGWMFQNMTTNLKGEISYYVTQGKDMISFKDLNNNQYVINRRGESRLSKNVTLNLPNESGFVVGAYEEASLRKLGYRNNWIFNHYLIDGKLDSVKVDREVNALSARWIFNNNQPLLVVEEVERVVIIDEFGYEKESVLKPEPNQSFAGLTIQEGFEYVFADNSQNALYLLDGYGKMIFPVPVTGSSVHCLKDRVLYTFAGTRIKVYKTD